MGIDDYDVTTAAIHESGLVPPKLQRCVWIGVVHESRRRLYDVGAQNPELSDIMGMHWSSNEDGGAMLRSTRYLSLADLVKEYSLLLDIEGGGYSGRLKYLLWSHRPVLLVDRPYKEFFFENLQPWVHFVPVERDLRDMVEKARWCLEHEEEARAIASNAYDFSRRYLTREACYAQWDNIIAGAR